MFVGSSALVSLWPQQLDQKSARHYQAIPHVLTNSIFRPSLHVSCYDGVLWPVLFVTAGSKSSPRLNSERRESDPRTNRTHLVSIRLFL